MLSACYRRLRNVFRSNLASNPERNMEEGYADGGENHELQELRDPNLQFFDICEREGVNSGINFLRDSGYLNGGSLSKVINTKNREGKDVITLIIEDNNPGCILTAFEYLTREDFNRKGERGYTLLHKAVRLKDSNTVKRLLESEHVDVELLDERSYKARKYIEDKETAKFFIEYYDRKISNLSREIASSDKKLVLTKNTLWIAKFIFASLAALGSINTYRRYFSVGIEYNSTTEKVLNSLSGTSGMVLLLNTCIDKGLSYYGEKNSSLRKKRENCIGERYEAERKLYGLRTRADLAAPQVSQLASVSSSVRSPEIRD